ncbi:hypothetical protein [Sphingobium sp. DC-2]|uniref:hypothetical protein n=1 Tax=Sphingobium sp. DC-2 TaxID=1303256 RepID=UPI00056BEA51|nr:hypothetical protein [Sphingobium sp. DC-2]
MNRKISLIDHTALTFLATGGRATTVAIASSCGLVVGRRCLPQARNMLRRLQRRGFIANGYTAPGHYALWTLTDADRKAVQP